MTAELRAPGVSSSGGATTLVVQEGDVTETTTADTLDFADADFDVTVSPAGEANIALTGDVARDADIAAEAAARDAAITAAINALIAATLNGDANFDATVLSALAGKVSLSLFDARAVLAGDGDGNPVAVILDASTILGRAATGGVVALDPSSARTVLGLVIGTNVQAYDADLTAIAALDSSSAGAIASDGAGWIKKTYAQFKTALGLTKSDVSLGNVTNDAQLKAADLDTDTTLAADSDTKVPSQHAVRTFVNNAVTGLLDYKGGLDASANPNYPAASKGDSYSVTVAGKVGGASGKSVDVSDTVIAIADNAGGTEASVGTSWIVLEHNLVGALLAANNLSDLSSASTALTNLGVSTFIKALLDDTNLATALATLGLDVDLATFVLPANTTISTFAATLLDDANAAAILATLGLDADLATLAVPASTTISAFGATIIDDANAAAVLATLGLDADLATFALPANTTISAFIATLLDDADAATARATLGLAIGTNVQAWDADLDALATAFGRATASGPASLLLAEDTDNGTNTVQVIAPASMAADRVLTLPDATDTLVGKATTDTLTNKRITKRTGTTTSSATPTINTDNVDFYSITALAAAITSFTTNLSGTPTEGQTLWIAITDNGTARAITWGASFEASTVALPTTTVVSTRLDVGFVWNTVTSKWRCVAVA